jgi:acetyl esterase/lipase
MKIYLVLFAFFILPSCATTVFSDYEFQNIFYKSKDNFEVKSDLYLPRQLKEKNPIVIVIHGGGWRSRSGDMASICKRLVNEGYIALNITYRLAPEFTHPNQENDVKAVLAWIQQNAVKYKIDTNKMYAWGYSAGAHLAFNLANEKEANIKAVVIGGTPTNLPAYPHSPMITQFIGATYQAKPDVWLQASPVSRVTEKSPPTFLYHGENDILVHIEQSEMLVDKLKEKKVQYEFYRVPVLEHVTVYFMSAESIKRGVDFIKRH